MSRTRLLVIDVHDPSVFASSTALPAVSWQLAMLCYRGFTVSAERRITAKRNTKACSYRILDRIPRGSNDLHTYSVRSLTMLACSRDSLIFSSSQQQCVTCT